MPVPRETVSDANLRQQRLVFYKDDVDLMDKVLAEFLRLAGAKCALLVDKEGHMVTRQGEVKLNMDTISALVAGSFAATKEMAKLRVMAGNQLSCSCRVTRPIFLKPAAEIRAITRITVP